MTPQEAHEYLEDFQRIMTQHREAYSKELIEANGQAILALEKQIPKKCTDGFHKEKFIDGRCPNCSFRQSKGDIQWKRQFNKFCRNCGQALDWGDDK